MKRAGNASWTLPVCGVAALLVLQLLAAPAQADEADIAKLQAQADQALAQIEDATQTYNDAQAEVTSLSEQIAQNEKRSAELEAKLPEQRERAAKSIRTLYIFQQSTPGLLGLILSSDDFNDFISTIRYIDAIQQHNTAQVEALASLEEELAGTQASLTAALDNATAKQDEAMAALDTVRATRESLEAQIGTLREAQAQRAAAEQSEALKIVEDAAQAADEAVADLPETAQQATAPATADDTGRRASASTKEAKSPEDPGTQAERGSTQADQTKQEQAEQSAPVEEPSTQENTASADSDSWAGRIDAYLAGSPLAGYGSVFAEAAATYGVDPRVSPAIAAVESSKGAVCFRPHNAWGWGGSGWSDWKTAINAHVSGFASGYGSTVTLAGAKKYCPPTYKTWYNLVWAEMNKI